MVILFDQPTSSSASFIIYFFIGSSRSISSISWIIITTPTNQFKRTIHDTRNHFSYLFIHHSKSLSYLFFHRSLIIRNSIRLCLGNGRSKQGLRNYKILSSMSQKPYNFYGKTWYEAGTVRDTKQKFCLDPVFCNEQMWQVTKWCSNLSIFQPWGPVWSSDDKLQEDAVIWAFINHGILTLQHHYPMEMPRHEINSSIPKCIYTLRSDVTPVKDL